MNHLKVKPDGADVAIQQLQQFLYEQLQQQWRLTDNDLEAYGRCYRMKTDTGYIPQAFSGDNTQKETTYQNIQFDDSTTNALFFFDVSEPVRYDRGTNRAAVDLIFQVNIPAVKPQLVHRGDEEIRMDVFRLLHQRRYGFTVREYGTGYKWVFSKFDGILSASEQVFRDAHPLHVFKVSMDLIFSGYNC